MKNKFRLWFNIVTICLCVCAIAIGVYSATTANLNASGKIGFTAHGCDVKIVGQVSNAIKNSEEGSLFFNNNADYLNDMENFIGNDGWTIDSIIFDEESAMETPPIIITLDVYNYSFFPVFATLNLGTEFAEYLTASNIDVSAKVGTDDYVFGSEFYIDEAVYNSNAEFVSSTYRQFVITISVNDDSTELNMSSDVNFFDMSFEKTLKQYDDYYVVPSYISVRPDYTEKLNNASVFSGWAGSIGAPKYINNIQFRVGACDAPITKINVMLAEENRNGTLIASEQLDVQIDANTNEYIVWTLSEPIQNTDEKTYYFGYTCNQLCDGYMANDSSVADVSMSYVTNGSMLTSFENWSNATGASPNYYKRYLPVIIGEVVPVVEYKDQNFTQTSSTYTGSLGTPYTTSTFSGWGGSIGAIPTVSALKFRVGARDEAITRINMHISQETKYGEIIAGAALAVNIEPNTYKDIIWKLSTPITGNTNNLYFSYTCNQYCNYYAGTTANVEGDGYLLAYTTNGNMVAPRYLTHIGNADTVSSIMFSIDIGEVYTNDNNDEDNNEDSAVLQTVDVHLAQSYDLVVNDVFQLFYRGVIRAVNPYNYYIKVVSSKGNAYPRFWQWTPTESDVGTHDLSIQVLNDNGQLIGEDSTILNVVNPMTGTTYSTAKNILCIGDSLTAAGTWVKEGYRRFCMTGGTPEGLGNADSLNFIGTKTVTVDGKTVGYEGTAGWTWASYLGSSSPFYNSETQSIDFVNYCTTNGYSGIDEVYFLLTWNGHGELYLDDYPTDTGNLKNAQTLIDILKTQFPNVKVTCLGIPLNSLGGGTGSNYQTSTSYGDAYGMYMTAFAYNKALENLCLSEKYSDFVRYVDTKAQFDGDYNYPTTEVPVNSRNPQTETIQSNGVHPNTYGYLQIADAFYRALCSRYVVA
ncbi:MAG: SGNH/GDSL hydrolase family protein [Clostridia bacterium]|nr:SGNH/GDSL hydrolase family protein [Clostridia bacterium]